MKGKKEPLAKIVIEKALKDYYEGLFGLSKIHGKKIDILRKQIKHAKQLYIFVSILTVIALIFFLLNPRIETIGVTCLILCIAYVFTIVFPKKNIPKLEDELHSECRKKLKKNIEKIYDVVLFDSHILYNGVYYVKPSYWNVYPETSVETKDIFDYVEETDEGEYKYYLSYCISGKKFKKQIKKKQYIHLSYMREERCYLKI